MVNLYIERIKARLEGQFSKPVEERDTSVITDLSIRLLDLYRDAEINMVPFEEMKSDVRECLSMIAGYVGKTELERGVFFISAPSKRPSYDTKTLDELSLSLIETHPDIASRIQLARKVTEVTGSLRVEQPKEKK